ncbi:MAG: glycine cleavage system protein GcvH [Moorea sp. SIO1F2]|uniref:glycine cleavage system protein GcvH n=1 Tax=unclassified Moorena TaxID=2683338 RepID=UPI0013B97085|nr:MULTISPECIES: glycine cleavage system protein GcvH [unclassified Moorena]NEO04464.1 glycine cleavage system protein GcvH [Moorena sp. SIO3I8]NEO21232.1 glycine cleavage system protein GcvH [Moorena sp. SIO4A5]NEP22308.1 glycine cleavage system protein GcvH [Moorena sp. SIO3I6]NEQ58109.1 glycine cleavage system protein GcvH [Moorena sp. SIO4A1]NET83698.1 glycine cleavage system protein GcvH [Moorena sp. SIO1F2]
MAFEYPDDLKYLDSHEYVRLDGEIATIGITAFAIDQLGDLVLLELPEIDDTIEKGNKENDKSFGTIESVKAVSDLYSPVSGTVVERNEEMIEAPEQIAEDPYGEGWLIKVRLNDPDNPLEGVLSAEEYRAKVEAE